MKLQVIIAITFPTRPTTGEDWGGFIADLESQGALVEGSALGFN